MFLCGWHQCTRHTSIWIEIGLRIFAMAFFSIYSNRAPDLWHDRCCRADVVWSCAHIPACAERLGKYSCLNSSALWMLKWLRPDKPNRNKLMLCTGNGFLAQQSWICIPALLQKGQSSKVRNRGWIEGGAVLLMNSFMHIQSSQIHVCFPSSPVKLEGRVSETPPVIQFAFCLKCSSDPPRRESSPFPNKETCF